jgi:hypothetical protein
MSEIQFERTRVLTVISRCSAVWTDNGNIEVDVPGLLTPEQARAFAELLMIRAAQCEQVRLEAAR